MDFHTIFLTLYGPTAAQMPTQVLPGILIQHHMKSAIIFTTWIDTKL